MKISNYCLLDSWWSHTPEENQRHLWEKDTTRRVFVCKFGAWTYCLQLKSSERPNTKSIHKTSKWDQDGMQVIKTPAITKNIRREIEIILEKDKSKIFLRMTGGKYLQEVNADCVQDFKK